MLFCLLVITEAPYFQLTLRECQATHDYMAIKSMPKIICNRVIQKDLTWVVALLCSVKKHLLLIQATLYLSSDARNPGDTVTCRVSRA